jgi:hypothetical protein
MTSNSNLLEILLEASCNQAEELLGDPAVEDQILERKILDLQISPLLDKQLTAAALRLARDLCLSGGIKRNLLNRFRAPPPGVAVEAQRRAIQSEVRNKGLPMELAGDYVDILERRFAVPSDELPEMLWSYASLYDDLWSDPRIGAGTPTRRIMLAMATVLRARSAQLVATRTTPTALPKYRPEEA